MSFLSTETVTVQVQYHLLGLGSPHVYTLPPGTVTGPTDGGLALFAGRWGGPISVVVELFQSPPPLPQAPSPYETQTFTLPSAPGVWSFDSWVPLESLQSLANTPLDAVVRWEGRDESWDLFDPPVEEIWTLQLWRHEG